jgi:hypothetical protein
MTPTLLNIDLLNRGSKPFYNDAQKRVGAQGGLSQVLQQALFPSTVARPSQRFFDGLQANGPVHTGPLDGLPYAQQVGAGLRTLNQSMNAPQ